MIRVLIAERNKNLGYVLNQELQEAGCAVDQVSDGVEAVQRVIDQNYDFILIDLLMAKLDGLSAIKLMKKIHPRARVMAFAESYGLPDKKEVLAAGADVCFFRPCKIEQIKKYIFRKHAAENRRG